MNTIGVDFGGTKTLVVAFDAAGNALARERMPTPIAAGGSAMLATLAAGVRKVADRIPGIAAIGLGFAGLVDADTGMVDSSVILPGFAGHPLADDLATRCGLPVHVENDATAAGFGEFVAGGRRDEDLLVVTIGTGIGGAVVLDGRLRRGASGTAGEFGNMTIDWRGTEHACGNRGCLNTLASGTAILAHARALAMARGTPLPDRLEDVAAAAAAGDAAAATAISDGARALGAGLANLTMAFNPHRIALMGGVLGLGARWFDTVVEETRRRSFPRAAALLEIAPCRRGEDTGALGAAMLAREALLR